MPLRANLRRLLIPALLVFWAAGIFVASSQTLQHGTWEDDFKPGSLPGKRTFNASCAGCHGLDGRGGERAPNIAGNAKLQRLSNAEVAAIISTGVPGTGMPAFHAFGPAQVKAVVSYLRFLQGHEKSQQLRGNAERGKAIFFGKGDCSSCHMVQGQGGFIGSDLSTYGSNRPVKEVLNAILDPASNTEWKRKAATAVTHGGHSVSGTVRNEDNFSVQLQTADGAFHFFSKSDLQSLQYQDHPVMPADYGKKLTPAELDDVASYLVSAGRSSRRGPSEED
ncbi:MAG TPA: c-type cytochrome [Candidatus Sulfotelmatobacter sp.]|nr:c-type cytochrome [Candidatus Sulfotelmatobacter sp.]